MKYKKVISLAMWVWVLCTMPATVWGASLKISSQPYAPIVERPAASTGLEALYVVWSTENASMTYTASSASSVVEVATFDMRGAAYATAVAESEISRSGAEVTIARVEGDKGYVVTENGTPHYYWITDYARHMYNVESISVVEPRECDRLFLSVEGSASRITYYSITGRSMELDRAIAISYNTLEAVADELRFEEKSVTDHVSSVSDGMVNIAAPLVDTDIIMTGDRFLRSWGMEQQVNSGTVLCESVTCVTAAEQTQRGSDNESKQETELGGSAPCEITFTATVNHAALFVEWQVSGSPEFEDVDMRYNATEFTYSFTEAGNSYVRFVCANAAGNCESQSEVYTVTVGESMLLCPNAFSPGASEGVNDEWKVSYRSIVSFECDIFNRWGTKMAHLSDPSQGWDGKYGGKLVPPGVYYYVIRARGGDGKTYNLSGDINIVGFGR